jgi:hypothetical protein
MTDLLCFSFFRDKQPVRVNGKLFYIVGTIGLAVNHKFYDQWHHANEDYSPETVINTTHFMGRVNTQVTMSKNRKN